MTHKQLANEWRRTAKYHLYEAEICGGGCEEKMRRLAASVLNECADDLDEESEYKGPIWLRPGIVFEPLYNS